MSDRAAGDAVEVQTRVVEHLHGGGTPGAIDAAAGVRLKPGDIVVQRGTNHAWSNRTDKPARIVFVLLDGHFAPELAK